VWLLVGRGAEAVGLDTNLRKMKSRRRYRETIKERGILSWVEGMMSLSYHQLGATLGTGKNKELKVLPGKGGSRRQSSRPRRWGSLGTGGLPLKKKQRKNKPMRKDSLEEKFFPLHHGKHGRTRMQSNGKLSTSLKN